MTIQDGVDNGIVLFFFSTVNFIMQILTLNRTVGRNFDAGEIINVAKLGFFSHCRTGHTCQFGI